MKIMNIDNIIMQELAISNKMAEEVLKIVENGIKKYGIKNSREPIINALRASLPKYIIESLKLGVKTLNKNIEE